MRKDHCCSKHNVQFALTLYLQLILVKLPLYPIHKPLPRTESLAMPEVVPVSGRVRNLKVYGHINKVSHFPFINVM